MSSRVPPSRPELSAAASHAAALTLRRARALTRRARSAATHGRDRFAIACLHRALAVADRAAPADARGADAATAAAARETLRLDCYVMLGDLCLRTSRHAEALDAYLQALRLAPTSVDLHLALAHALSIQQLPGEAIPILDRASRLAPERADVQIALGDALRDSTRERALACYELAMRIDPDAIGAYQGLARLHADAGDYERALAIIARGPYAVELGVERARVLLRRGSPADATEAVVVLQRVLNQRPRHVEAGRLLVDALERLGRREDLVGAFVALGAALDAEGIEAGRSPELLGEAAGAYQAALALKPDCLRAWMRLADVQLALGTPESAVRSLEAAVAIDPEQPVAHVNLGWARRIAGDFVGGWRESVWHYRAGDKRRFEQPVWEGAPLGAQTLLVWADFALGDTIQDLRFLPRVRAAHPHARLIVECSQRLVSLLESSRAILGIDEVIATKAPVPAFDLHSPLRRLQEQFVRDLDSLSISSLSPSGAATPYMIVDPERVALWRQRIQHPTATKTIGIVWAAEQTRPDARIKSAALADFAPLAAFHRHGVRIISLQLGPHVDELIAPPRGLRVARLLDEHGDSGETAALMQVIDLVITVDTMTAHLAGALGVPVWVLAAHAPAWWLWHVMPPDGATGATRSRWYPSMRLFQQTRPGDWEGVMQQVCAALQAQLA